MSTFYYIAKVKERKTNLWKLTFNRNNSSVNHRAADSLICNTMKLYKLTKANMQLAGKGHKGNTRTGEK